MQELLQRLHRIDFHNAIQTFLSLVDDAPLWFLGLVVGILVILGTRMVAGQPGVQSWGLRLAASAFLAHAGYLWFSGKADTGQSLSELAMRSGCVAGLVLAVAWIVLPILSFAQRRFRFTFAVFLGYGAYAAWTRENFSSEHLPQIAVHSLIAAGFALIVAWILDPFWCALSRYLFPVRPQAETPQVMETPVESVKRTVRPTMLVPGTPLLAALEPVASEGQRRRDKARMQLELAYLQAMPGISGWLPRPMFDDFLKRHLADHLSPEEAEENARQLLGVLQQHQEKVHQRAEFTSLDDLTEWLMTEQQRIRGLTLEGTLKQTQLIDLHQRYLVLASRMVKEQTSLSI